MKNIDRYRKASVNDIADMILEIKKRFNKYCSEHVVCTNKVSCKQCEKIFIRKWFFLDEELEILKKNA